MHHCHLLCHAMQWPNHAPEATLLRAGCLVQHLPPILVMRGPGRPKLVGKKRAFPVAHTIPDEQQPSQQPSTQGADASVTPLPISSPGHGRAAKRQRKAPASRKPNTKYLALPAKDLASFCKGNSRRYHKLSFSSSMQHLSAQTSLQHQTSSNSWQQFPSGLYYGITCA